MSVVKKPTVLFERFPYRYVECGIGNQWYQTIVFKKQMSALLRHVSSRQSDATSDCYGGL